MSQSWPVQLQTALLYDHAEPVELTTIMQNFLKIEQNVRRLSYNVVEDTGIFVQLFCPASDVMVCAEWVSQPTRPALFAQALGSSYNTVFTAPNAREAIARHRGYLIVNVRHGVIPPLAMEQQAFLKNLGVPLAGQSVAHFTERHRVLALAASLACDVSEPTLVHWTVSEVLARLELVRSVLPAPGPSPLSVHPVFFRAPETSPEDDVVGFETFGARHYIGREIRMRPSAVPIFAAYHHALGFMNLALMKDGYVIPDGDTFGDDEGGFCYRVHHDGEPAPLADPFAPCYELEPLSYAETGFRSPDYLPPDEVLDLGEATRRYENFAGREGKRTVAEWRERAARAKRAGVSFQVKAAPGALQPRRKGFLSRLFGME